SMLAGSTDLAMHSLKDLPVNIREEFRLGAILKRHSFLDAIIFRNSLYSKLGLVKGEVLDAQKLKSLGKLRIATSSLRRKCLLENLHSNIDVVPIRGNVDTRLQKLEDLNLDAIILAEASLNRLSIENVHAHKLDYKWFIPCAGQGALTIELPASSRFSQFIEKLNCDQTNLHVSIERNILRALGGDCNMPFGCLVATCERDPTKTLGQVLVMTPSGKECRVNHTVLTAELKDGQQFASILLDKLRDVNVNSLLEELKVKIRL
ncbi:MAG: hydroxymethylbilane synthase, partial [Proteobacteria bacterium]|nr:hydroxymethylbilane synthase [Pseudomonadota bacterium]